MVQKNELIKFLVVLLLGVGLGSISPVPALQDGIDPCELKGAVFVEEVESFARFRVFREDVEAFADLLVFQEQARSFADRPGLWYFTDNRSVADFTIAFTETQGFADFSVYFTDFKTLAGCRR
jgi:hypothetical protein